MPFLRSSLLRLSSVALAAACALGAHAQSAGVKVGLLSTLSGPGAGLGVDIRDGFQLAMKHLGGKLGGQPAEIIIQPLWPGPGPGTLESFSSVARPALFMYASMSARRRSSCSTVGAGLLGASAAKTAGDRFSAIQMASRNARIGWVVASCCRVGSGVGN